ncbi:MAG: carboxypeptidase-like regulatory domain-containing protein, partial [Alphaproteobacteria bacterium]
MTSGNIRLAVALLLAVAVFLPRCARAAENPAVGHIEGHVKDALDRPVDGARLALEAADGRTIGKTTSNPQGAFAFTGIAPGVYS